MFIIVNKIEAIVFRRTTSGIGRLADNFGIRRLFILFIILNLNFIFIFNYLVFQTLIHFFLIFQILIVKQIIVFYLGFIIAILISPYLIF